MNHLVDSLLRRVGCEHRITSAYNPRTNGQTERANQTICEALRKHTETEPKVWDKWLPFVCLAYNTRIHSVTGYTPFELLFGNKMNGFEDWTITNSNLNDIELFKRAEEIANLGSNIRQKALVNIKEGQVAQRQNQENRIPPSDKTLDLNSKVFIKQEGIIGKLEPRFKGPYTVASCNPSSNYELYDCDNNLLPNSYSLHKLKPVLDPQNMSQESWEVEKILNHRKNKKENEYLVKWKNCPNSENTWLKTSYFNSTTPIKEYLDSLKNKENTNVVEDLLVKFLIY